MWQVEKWQGVSVVSDIKNITNATDRLKVRTIDSVYDELFAGIDAMAGRAWIYDPDYAKENSSVTVRSGGIGFDIVFSAYLPGEIGIFDNLVKLDTDISVLTQ
jgi:hypothetical protein